MEQAWIKVEVEITVPEDSSSEEMLKNLNTLADHAIKGLSPFRNLRRLDGK